jgi:aldehyde:ferredoxin oxidoreductase
MLDAYYETREWNKITGYPKRDKLVSLGLDLLVEDIW